MEFSETHLIEFFGVSPVAEDPDEKEFFGSSHFIFVEGELTLNISFSTHEPMVMMNLFLSGQDGPFLCAEIQTAKAVRIDKEPRRLVVLAKSEGEAGSDPKLEERMAIFIDPLRVFVFR